MRGRASWLVVAALAVIAAVAAADALRGGPGAAEPAQEREPEQAPAPAPTTTEAEPAAATGEFGGVLYYTDDDCRLRAVRLPALTEVEAPNWHECRFLLSPDGARASGAGSGWDPHSDPRIGRLFLAEDGVIRVAANLGPEGEPVEGEAAAWRPDGTLTYYSGATGTVRLWPSGRVLLGQDELAEAVRAHPDVPDSGRVRRVTVRELAWLDERRLVMLLATRIATGSEDFAAVYEGRRLVAASFGYPGPLSDLRTSPRGGYFAARVGERGLLLLDAEGGPTQGPPLTGYRAIAFSPDERWAAAATFQAVFVFRLGEPPLRLRRLPLAAHDLAWRGRVSPPPLPEADEARAWLGSVRATGRLFLTEPGCHLRALRLPTLEWEDDPDGSASPCRFTLGLDEAPLDDAVAVQLQGRLRALCTGSGVRVFGAAGPVAAYEGACTPSWTPDGRLTFIRGGELFLAEPPREEEVLVSRAALRRMFGREALLEEVAWFDDRRLWAAVRVGDQATLALMSTEALVFSPTFTAREVGGLQVSATGMVAARTERGVVFFDSGGRRALSFPGARAVSWAPGELVAAVAGPSEILFVAPVSREVVILPLTVQDLEWVVP